MIRKLKLKLICINMFIVTVLLLGIFFILLSNTRWDLASQGYRTIERIQSLPQGMTPPRGDLGQSYFILYRSPQGEASMVTHGFFEQYTPQELLTIGQRTAGQQKGVLGDLDLRFARKTTPKGEITVFLDISMEDSMLRGLIQNCVKVYCLSFLLFLGLSILLAQWAVRPVEQAWKAQRQFVADASHELKTPLTVIMTNAELLRDRIGEDACAMSILSMSRQMRGLVEGLLDLARVDNGMVKTSFLTLDLGALVEHCLLPFEPVLFEAGLLVEARLEENILVKGSDEHLRQVVDILLDNARKYGSPAQPVRISLTRQGSHALLRVSTAGEEISPQDLKDIFKRFYRIDKARAMNRSYGLGLSIARSILQEHRGKIWAESKAGVNSFIVQLPVEKANQPLRRSRNVHSEERQ